MSKTLEKFIHFTHEYERSKSNKEIYRCLHPKCTHYKKREFLIGKEAICHKCKNTFILTLIQLKNKIPVCDYCTKSPKAQELKRARTLVEGDLNLSILNQAKEELKKETKEEFKNELAEEIKAILLDNLN